ncbi:hypothetical protein AB5T01_004222 [Escherichia albertii]
MATMSVFIAFYRGNSSRRGLTRFKDWAIRIITRSIYSHCEIVTGPNDYETHTQFVCRSSSWRDGGVREKRMALPIDKWDLVEINATPHEVAVFFEKLKGKKYDLAGVFGFLLFCRGNAEKWFCSEFCAEFLELRDAWRYSPGQLYALVTSERERGYTWRGVTDN